MRMKTFFEKFDLFADAPNAVTKMRELVLALAMQGKLVAQDVGDEPASNLLKRIHAEKSRRKTRTESIEKELSRDSDGDRFSIPGNWEWIGATTPAIVISDQGKKVQTKDILESGMYPVVDQGKVFIRGYCNDFKKVIHVSEPIVVFGDHTRETKLINFDFVVGADGVKLLQPVCIDPNFYFLALRWLPLESRGYGRHFKLLRASIIPLPPLAEQKRIVAKVEELMALCNRLEAQQQEREARHADLSRAALARFADAPTPANLHFLFHPAYAIAPADLRKTILTLAVQGKLVPQDPNDEPAEVLIDKISELREQSLAGKRAKATKKIRDLDSSKCDHDIPDEWIWCRLGDLVLSFRYGTSRKCSRDLRGVPVLRIPNVKGGRIDSTDLKFTAMPDSEFKELRLQEGDLLLVRSNGSENLVGRSAAISTDDERFAYAGYLVRARIPKAFIFTPYLHIALDTPSVRNQIEGPIRTTSGVKNINTTELSNLILPLPPLAEQRRIVARVEELMALVDQLETQLAASRATAANLLEALVAELTAQA